MFSFILWILVLYEAMLITHAVRYQVRYTLYIFKKLFMIYFFLKYVTRKKMSIDTELEGKKLNFW